MPQGRRDGVMLRFRSGRARLLVATNVAARGLDISHVSHVFSYDVPDDPEEYTHRIGRTGRVGRTGIAYTFMTNRDRKGVAEIERVTGARVRHFTAEQVIRGEELKALAPELDAPRPCLRTTSPTSASPATAAPPREQASRATARPPSTAQRRGRRGSARLFVNAGKRHGVRREASPRPSPPAASSPGACACTTPTASSTSRASERTRRSPRSRAASSQDARSTSSSPREQPAAA